MERHSPSPRPHQSRRSISPLPQDKQHHSPPPPSYNRSRSPVPRDRPQPHSHSLTNRRDMNHDLIKVSMTMANHLLSKQELKEKNVVFSPLLIHSVLIIIAAGSEGTTHQKLLDFLGSKSIDHLNSFASHLLSAILNDPSPASGPCVSFVNGLWVEQSLSLKPSFKQIVYPDYKAALSSVDFKNKADKVTNDVNSWANKETNGLIEKILPPGLRFHNGSSVKVPFMTNGEKQFIGAFDDFKVLCLPYNKGEDTRKFSMYIFLPNTRDGLSALVEKVASESELLHHKLHLSKVKVGDFRIPRFKVSFEQEISDILKELGVGLDFSLTKMVDSLPDQDQDHFVSQIFHKSFIEVNEEGTEAAAVTACTVEIRGISIISHRLDFVADHPFLFLIREDSTETILFVGHVLNPLV
ncbi:serpin-like protein [Medicago truncatula]|uniref:Serpin-like protein n=1 Tax=Medicago truncatula TaxID=3880 RepID=A0A072VCB8_MEDTR|nr:serpin-like protein [Medicago truncatula]